MVPGTYTITEEKIDRYVPNQSQTITVSSGKTSSISFYNILKKFRVTVTKQDYEKDTHKVTQNSAVQYMVYSKVMTLLLNIQLTKTVHSLPTIMFAEKIGL